MRYYLQYFHEYDWSVFESIQSTLGRFCRPWSYYDSTGGIIDSRVNGLTNVLRERLNEKQYRFCLGIK